MADNSLKCAVYKFPISVFLILGFLQLTALENNEQRSQTEVKVMAPRPSVPPSKCLRKSVLFHLILPTLASKSCQQLSLSIAADVPLLARFPAQFRHAFKTRHTELP